MYIFAVPGPPSRGLGVKVFLHSLLSFSSHVAVVPFFEAKYLEENYKGHSVYLASILLSSEMIASFPCRDLRCVRNTIHIHLMLTYLLLDTCWLLAATSQVRTFMRPHNVLRERLVLLSSFVGNCVLYLSYVRPCTL